MTPKKSKAHSNEAVRGLLAAVEEFLKATVRDTCDDLLEAEMNEAHGAAKDKRR